MADRAIAAALGLTCNLRSHQILSFPRISRSKVICENTDFICNNCHPLMSQQCGASVWKMKMKSSGCVWAVWRLLQGVLRPAPRCCKRVKHVTRKRCWKKDSKQITLKYQVMAWSSFFSKISHKTVFIHYDLFIFSKTLDFFHKTMKIKWLFTYLFFLSAQVKTTYSISLHNPETQIN